MSKVQKLADRWLVHMGSAAKSTEIVEVRMSAEMAAKLVDEETRTMARLNPDQEDLHQQTLGSAVLAKLGRFRA